MKEIFKAAALRSTVAAGVLLAIGPSLAHADELFYVSGAVGNAVANFKTLVQPWEQATGHTVTMVPMPASTMPCIWRSS